MTVRLLMHEVQSIKLLQVTHFEGQAVHVVVGYDALK